MDDDDLAGGALGLADLASDLRAVDAAARGLSGAMGNGLRQALDRAVFGGLRLSDTLRGLAADLAQAGLRAAVAPVTSALAQDAQGFLDTAMRGAVGGIGASVRGFARGGVIAGGTAFPMASGIGLVGEAGPEAILPLSRGSDGRLGVRGAGGVQVTLNVTTPDAESFQHSRSQVTAALARAVARGAARL